MLVEFQKMNGLGNDFVMVDDREGELSLDADQVAALCDRHFGIGADGVILVRRSPRPECASYMHYINSDGSLAQMCGNGVRCFAKYLVDNGIVEPAEGSLVADTLAGPKPISFAVDGSGLLERATVDMGEPILDPSLVPVDAAADGTDDRGVPCVRDLVVESPWGPFSFACVSMGNPHAVAFVDDFGALPDDAFVDAGNRCLASLDVDKVGCFFESHPLFPEKTNVEFAHVERAGGQGEPGVVSMRVYERGCAETLACGTGACAVDVASALTGRSGRANRVRLRGGDLDIVWAPDNHVFMTGPAALSFHGTVEL